MIFSLPPSGYPTDDRHITCIAFNGQHGKTYLSRSGRREVFNQILGTGLPGKGTLKLDSMDDVQLCKLWTTGMSIDFVRAAYPNIPFPHVGVRLYKRFK